MQWRPSKAQRKAFAIKMQNPAEAAAYEARKAHKAEVRRAGSSFDYESAGGKYKPTQFQYNFCCENMDKFITEEEKMAANIVINGYTCNESVHHDYIHIVNEKIRIS